MSCSSANKFAAVKALLAKLNSATVHGDALESSFLMGAVATSMVFLITRWPHAADGIDGNFGHFSTGKPTRLEGQLWLRRACLPDWLVENLTSLIKFAYL